ncbi:anaphase-promoting complex subunit cdc27 [Lobaria immixta]|nr:anaphase-promoting complex subunit cdc27 [Lobaria immixta]
MSGSRGITGVSARRPGQYKHTETRRQQLPDAAAFYCLQGKLWHAHQDINKAIECYVEALEFNPFMWDAFLGLCDLGVKVRVPKIFKMTPAMKSALSNPSTDDKTIEIPEEPQLSSGLSQAPTNSSNPNQLSHSNDPFSISKNRINAEVRLNLGSSALFEKFNGSRNIVTPIGGGGVTSSQSPDTPIAQGGSSIELPPAKDSGAATNVPSSTEPPAAPTRKARTLQGLGLDFSADAPSKARSNSMRQKSGSKDSEEVESTMGSRMSALNNTIGERKRTVSGQPPQPTSTNSNANISNSNDPMAPTQRRSVRLFNQIRPQSGKFSSSTGSLGAKDGRELKKEVRELKKAKATGTKGRSGNTYVGRVVSGNRNHGDAMEVDGKEQRPLSSAQNGTLVANAKPAVTSRTKELESLQWLLDLFTKLGSGYFTLSHYQCKDALLIFNSITPSQRDTPWVLAQMGRAMHEQAHYVEAEKYFARIKTMAPARLEDVEIYSTTLWQLKKNVDLAFLAHEIIELDRDSPQAWCVVGNSFSLQGDHGQAIKCFKRATQLDPKFAYAYTLRGHEHILNDEFDKALAAFRSAITAERRHYNAWYGLGTVFSKQEKYEFAEQHFRIAASINPTNAILICNIGIMLEKLNNLRGALAQYSRSCELGPKIAVNRMKKAEVLQKLNEPQQALLELRVLKDMTPDDSKVHRLLGNVYKVLKQRGMAIRHFTAAISLDPMAADEIKSDMEHMEEMSDDEDGDVNM